MCRCSEFYLLGCFRIAYFIPALVQCTDSVDHQNFVVYCVMTIKAILILILSWSCRSHVTLWDGELREAEMMIRRRIMIHHHVVVPGVVVPFQLGYINMFPLLTCFAYIVLGLKVYLGLQ